jgi:hypothetical protein
MTLCLAPIAGNHWKCESMPQVEKFIWSQLGNVPDKPGIYAWYYSPEITKFDMTKFVEAVKQMSSEGRIPEAQDSIRRFLDKYGRPLLCPTLRCTKAVLRGRTPTPNHDLK